MEQPEKSAAESETKCGRAFRLEEERGIVQAQFLESLTQKRVFVRVNRIKAREDHRLEFFEPRKSFDCWPRVVGDGVADFRISDVLDIGNQESNLACFKQ